MWLSQRAQNIKPSATLAIDSKAKALKSQGENVINFGVGEPDYATPWHVSEAAVHSLEKGYTMYTSNSGMPELRELISRYLADRYQVEYDPASEILVTIGVSEGLDLAMRALRSSTISLRMLSRSLRN